MIILGDVIDKGNNSIKMIKFVRNHPNIQMILGNHEYSFLNQYHILMQKLSRRRRYKFSFIKATKIFSIRNKKIRLGRY